VLVLDNYDSFTFNLVQHLGGLDASIAVFRNDEIGVEDVAAREPDAVVISPGPGDPARAGISTALVGWCARTTTPLLGVCLGHQAIVEAFGGRIVRGERIMHGKTSCVHHTGEGVLTGIPTPFEAMRYHSLVAQRDRLPEVLRLTAWTEDDVVMGVRHVSLPIDGVQFHPESILTPVGQTVLRNFIESAAVARSRV
jgi:anthranilate synthase component II